MLYKLKDASDRTRFVALRPASLERQGFLEKKMEQWLADNPLAILPEDEGRVLVISQEQPFENVTDILAVDSQGNVLIIEVKRGQCPRDVIAQAIEYASDVAEWDYEVLNARAVKYFAGRNLSYTSLLHGFTETFGIDPGGFQESQFNQQQRIFVVGERIDAKVERAARWLLKRDIVISCLSYTCYVSDDESKDIFLDIQEVVRPLERQGTTRRSMQSVDTPTEEEATEQLPNDLKAVYLELQKRASAFGTNVTTYATANNLIFRANKVFAEIPFRGRKNSLIFRVRPEGFSIPEKQSANVDGITVNRVPNKHGWSVNHWFEVFPNSDIDAVSRLLRQSYDGVSR